MTVGERTKLFLVKNKVNQKDVARGVGLTEDKLCQALNGNRKLSADEFESIINYLGVSADEIMGVNI